MLCCFLVCYLQLVLTSSSSKRITFLSVSPNTVIRQAQHSLSMVSLFTCVTKTAPCGIPLPCLVSTVAVCLLSCHNLVIDKKIKEGEVYSYYFFNIPCMLCCLYSICESSLNKTVPGCFVGWKFTTVSRKKTKQNHRTRFKSFWCEML